MSTSCVAMNLRLHSNNTEYQSTHFPTSEQTLKYMKSFLATHVQKLKVKISAMQKRPYISQHDPRTAAFEPNRSYIHTLLFIDTIQSPQQAIPMPFFPHAIETNPCLRPIPSLPVSPIPTPLVKPNPTHPKPLISNRHNAKLAMPHRRKKRTPRLHSATRGLSLCWNALVS